MKSLELKLNRLAELSGIEPEPFDGMAVTWELVVESSATDRPLLSLEQCERIAETFATAYFTNLSRHQLNRLTKDLRQRVVRAPKDASNAWHQYVQGAALATNLLPPPVVTAHGMSDVDAIHLDWLTIGSDVHAVWTAIARIHDWLEVKGRKAVENSQGGRHAA